MQFSSSFWNCKSLSSSWSSSWCMSRTEVKSMRISVNILEIIQLPCQESSLVTRQGKLWAPWRFFIFNTGRFVLCGFISWSQTVNAKFCWYSKASEVEYSQVTWHCSRNYCCIMTTCLFKVQWAFSSTPWSCSLSTCWIWLT